MRKRRELGYEPNSLSLFISAIRRSNFRTLVSILLLKNGGYKGLWEVLKVPRITS